MTIKTSRLNIPRSIAPLHLGDLFLFSPLCGQLPKRGELFRCGIAYFRTEARVLGFTLARRYKQWQV